MLPFNMWITRGRSLAGSRRTRRRSGVLLVAELALTLTLLAGAGLMAHSARALHASDRIVDPDTLLSTRLALPVTRYRTAEDRRQFLNRLEPALAARPETASAALATVLPFTGSTPRAFRLTDTTETARAGLPTAIVVGVSDSYFSTLRLPILAGRPFTNIDGRVGQNAAIRGAVPGGSRPARPPAASGRRRTRRDA
jgi:hypothetical protein